MGETLHTPPHFSLCTALRRRFSYPQIAFEATEPQSGVFTCSRSHKKEMLGTELEIRALADSSAGLTWLNCLSCPTRMGRERGCRKGAGALAFLKTLPGSWIGTAKADQSNSCLLFHQQPGPPSYPPAVRREGRVGVLVRGAPEAPP